MTREEAIRYIKDNVCYGQEECFDGICKSTEDNPCAIEIAIEALEKQRPMAVSRHTIYNEYLQAWERIRVCPVCEANTPVSRDLESWEGWCPDCGQRLNWRKTEGNSNDTQKED